MKYELHMDSGHLKLNAVLLSIAPLLRTTKDGQQKVVEHWIPNKQLVQNTYSGVKDVN